LKFYLGGCVQFSFVIFSPYLQGLRLGQYLVQRLVRGQQTRRFEKTQRTGKPTQRFFIRGFICEIFHDNNSALDQTPSCVLDRFSQRADVMQRSSEEDRVKLAIGKIGPSRNARVHMKPPRNGDGIAVGIDRHNRVSVIR
jgi:hypothetical protein